MARLKATNQEPVLELHERATPSVEAHHPVNGLDTGRNSGGRRIKKQHFYSSSQAKFNQELFYLLRHIVCDLLSPIHSCCTIIFHVSIGCNIIFNILNFNRLRHTSPLQLNYQIMFKKSLCQILRIPSLQIFPAFFNTMTMRILNRVQREEFFGDVLIVIVLVKPSCDIVGTVIRWVTKPFAFKINPVFKW